MKLSSIKAVRLLTITLALVAFLVTPMVPALAQQGSASYTAKFPTTTASKLVDADPAITGIEIINHGSVTVYLGATSTVTAAAAAATDGIPLYASNRIVLTNVVSPIYGITASGTGNLRIVITKGGGSVETTRLQTTGISNGGAANTIPMSNGSDLVAGNALVYNLTSAITANSTSCSDNGAIAITSNATGRGSIFRCDGSNYQLLSNYNAFSQLADLGTVATTGNSDDYIVAAYAGTLVSLDCSGVDALTANDTNYLTATLVNLGQAGAGSTAMLAASDANTTKATGGTGFAANAKRTFTVHGTGANLIVAAGDRLRLRFAATGTLANTVTFTRCIARFTRLS